MIPGANTVDRQTIITLHPGKRFAAFMCYVFLEDLAHKGNGNRAVNRSVSRLLVIEQFIFEYRLMNIALTDNSHKPVLLVYHWNSSDYPSEHNRGGF